MKKSFLIPLSMTAFASLEAQAKDVSLEAYQVQKGDCFSSIVMQYVQEETKNISFSSRKFKDAFRRFQVLNSHITDFDKIFLDQVIHVPVEYGKNKKQVAKNYEIKYGDTVYKVIREFLSKEDPWDLITVLKELNPSLKDVDFIKAGEILRIPTEQYILSLKQMNKGRLPSSIEIGKSQRRRFQSNFLIEQDIYYMPGAYAQEFIENFRKIVDANKKIDVMKGLKASLELSRMHNKKHLEDVFLFLISSTLKSKKDDIYLSDIRLFFETWKSIRKQKTDNREDVI